jgi:sphingolipid delta-4 desaturase
VWLALYALIYTVRGMSFIGRPNRYEVGNAVLQVAFTGVLWWAMGPVAVAYLAAALFFGHSLHPVMGHFIHEHYSFEDGQETFSYYGPINLVTFNVGYHVEHHDFMSIPGSRLPRVKALAPEFYDSEVGHHSWTGVLWRFIVDPRMGLHRRIVRSRHTFLETRRSARPTHWRGTVTPARRGLLHHSPLPAPLRKRA